MPRDSLDLLNLNPWLGDASSAQIALWQAENHWASLCPQPVALPPGEVVPPDQPAPDQPL